MKSKAFLILLFSCFIFIAPLSAQISNMGKNPSILERVYFGGGLDLQLNNAFGIIGASPSVGYMLTNSTSIGTGVTYQYISYRLMGINSDIYGYRFFLRQNLFRNIFAYTEYENLSNRLDPFDESKGRFWNNAYYIGGGLFQPFNDKAGFLMIGLYDLTRRNFEGSPFSFRAGITFSPF